MLAELRVYTVNKGAMDAFLEHFEKFSIPLHEAVGITIEATWVNRDRTEFVWVRSFEDEEDRARKVKAFMDERAARGIVLGDNVAKMESRDISPVLVSALRGS